MCYFSEVIEIVKMKFTDQTGYSFELPKIPERIISLVPSQSELIWDLGLSDSLIGITKFCIHPKEMFQTIERIGGTKQIDFEKLRKLQPDLIIGNKEENDKCQIEELRRDFPVWLSDVNDLNDAYGMIDAIGKLTGKHDEASRITEKILTAFGQISNVRLAGKTAAYLMWNEPFMAAAGDTFINAMLCEIGLVNIFKNKKRYPQIEFSELQKEQPDFILLSTEPYPFNLKHVNEIQKICPSSKVILVDGEMFSWYGSRLRLAPDYFNSISY